MSRKRKSSRALIPGTDVELLDDRMAALLEPVDTLAADPDNPRKSRNTTALARMFRRFGYSDPIVVNADTRMIEAGHQRLAAIITLGGTQIPVLWSQHGKLDAKAYNLAHNRSNEIAADWDDSALVRLLGELRAEDGTEAIGWDSDELDDLLRVRETETPTPDVPEAPLSRVGWLWTVGPHRLACGDSTDPKVVELATGGQMADMAFTDPPYGVDYTGGPGKEWAKISNDAPDDDALAAFTRAAIDAMPVRPGGAVYVCHASTCAHIVRLAMDHKIRVASYIVWAKSAPTFGRGDYHWQHEGIWYGWVAGAAHRPVANRRETTLWHERRDSGYKHPTQKPVSLPARAIRNSSAPGELVFDGFSGSGSTGVAAIQLGRVAVAIELSPAYADLGARRWAIAAGVPAIATLDGEVVGEIAP